MAFKNAVWQNWLEDGFEFRLAHGRNRDRLRDSAEFTAVGVDGSRFDGVTEIPDNDFHATAFRARHFGDGFLACDDEIVFVELGAENDGKIFIRRRIGMAVDFARGEWLDIRLQTMQIAEIGGITGGDKSGLAVCSMDDGRRAEHVRKRVVAVGELDVEAFVRLWVVMGIDV